MDAVSDTDVADGLAGGATTAPDDETQARLRRLEGLYGAVEAAVQDMEALMATGGSPRPAQPPPEPLYANVETWVQEWFAPMFGRRLGATHWCLVWWKHTEAVFRLEALWRSWENLRLDGTMGMAIWIRDHLDSGRRELLGPDGPFQACDTEGANAHNPPPALPTTPTPPGWPDEPSTERTTT